MTNPHGGKRPNAGRKPGTGTGRKTVSRSVSLTPDQWNKLDLISDRKRSKWIAEKIEAESD